jgi:hypothetical protein
MNGPAERAQTPQVVVAVAFVVKNPDTQIPN